MQGDSVCPARPPRPCNNESEPSRIFSSNVTRDDASLNLAEEAIAQQKGPPSFPFLRLPAELRNRVYTIALSDLEMDDEPLRKILTRASFPLRTDVDYRSLTQTCRLIRREFRPLYLAEKLVTITSTDTLAYLKGYYEIHEPSRSLEKQQGRLNIIMADYHCGYDLVPLLDFCYNMHDIQVNFCLGKYLSARDEDCSMISTIKESYRHAIEVINSSLVEEREAWCHAVQKDLSEAVVRIFHILPSDISVGPRVTTLCPTENRSLVLGPNDPYWTTLGLERCRELVMFGLRR